MNEYQKRVLEARKGIIKLTLEQQKEIQKIYEDMSKNLIPQILNMKDCRTKIHQIEIYKIVNQYQTELYNKLNSSITSAINKAAFIETGVQLSFVDMIAPNVRIKEALNRTITNISSRTVEQLIAGNYYKDGKTLNKRIWGYTERNYSQIDKIIKSNIAKGANVKELAKDLNGFVRPSAKTTASINRLGLDSSICYQAQRLARTSITHAQTEVKIQNAKNNPFCKGLRWCLSSSHERQDICDDYEGKVFEPDDVPLQHPNCMCYFEDVLEDMDNAIDRINRWAEGAEDTKLDKWCEGFDKTKEEETKTSKQPKVNGKDGTINIKIPKTSNKKADTNVGKSDIINRKVAFNPAHTIAEAEKFAKETLGIVNSNYKGCDVTTANEWNRGLLDSFNRFPALKNNFGFAGECHERNKQLRPVLKEYFFNKAKSINSKTDIRILDEIAEKQTKTFMRRMAVSKNTYAQSWSPTQKEFKGLIGVTVNKDYGKNSKMFIEALSKDVKNKYHPIGCDSIRSVLDHEIGHQLDSLLNVSNQKNIQELFKSKSKKQLTKEISEYSWNNDNSNKYGEFIAEGWAEYCNNPNPRHIAKEIGETIERLYKEWEKKNL